MRYLMILIVISVLGMGSTAYADEVSPTTTVPATTVPPTTVPDTTIPPDTTVPPTTVPEDIVPPTTVPPPPPVVETQSLNSVREVGAAIFPAELRSTHSFSITAGNLNGDNRPDLVFGLHSKIRAYLNLPTGMQLVFQHNGLDSHGCDIGDVNNDDRGDIYCVLGGGHGNGAKSNLMLIQGSDGVFTNQTATWGASDPYGRGRHPRFIDLNGDSNLDLFVGNESPREDGRPSPNRTWINTGSTFRSASLGVTREVGGLCVEPVDQNRDGREDILVCGGRGPATPGQPTTRHDRLHLYRRAGSGFQDVALQLNVGMPFAQGAVIANLDNNMSMDLAMVNRSRFEIAFGSGTRFGRRLAVPMSAGRSVAIGRFDGGTSRDVLVVQGCADGVNKPDYILLGKRDQPGEFVIRRLPNAAGCGDTAEAVDLDLDGRVEFVVSNGQWGATGPMQVFTTGNL